jgi:hypothetical protein
MNRRSDRAKVLPFARADEPDVVIDADFEVTTPGLYHIHAELSDDGKPTVRVTRVSYRRPSPAADGDSSVTR